MKREEFNVTVTSSEGGGAGRSRVLMNWIFNEAMQERIVCSRGVCSCCPAVVLAALAYPLSPVHEIRPAILIPTKIIRRKMASVPHEKGNGHVKRSY